MIQFTEQEIKTFRERIKSSDAIVRNLKKDIQVVWEQPILVPDTGIGNWYMYYFCKNCSLPLTFDREKPHEHRCEKCGSVYQGEPYDSTWWGIVNSENARACKAMGLLYMLTEEAAYARKAADIMLKYAEYYPDYEVHGDIPYNGPGKANAQTLDEAVFLRTLAEAYDLISQVMTEAERQTIRERIFRVGGQFLLEHRNRQVHNHEVLTNAALGILGILLEEPEYLDAALYQPYGLIYQLEHGMQEDHMWFEGTFGYHFYALENFFAFEKFAVHTPYSSIHHPNYVKMMELVLDFLHEDGTFPLINDIYCGHGSIKDKFIYEFAYRQLPTPRMLQILNLIYKDQKRDNLEAFLYGVDVLEEAKAAPGTCHWDTGSGYTVLRGEPDRYLLFKHGGYGGEHDHYDRLGISYRSHGRRIAPDIGTTGYGALLHYDYYKNTGTHNTVTIGGKNQPPVRGKTLRFETLDGITYVEAKADWRDPCELPDSFTIVQWDEAMYRTVSMTRKIAWAEDYMVDVFLVDGAPDTTIDWVIHLDGIRRTGFESEVPVAGFSAEKPWNHLHDMTMDQKEGWVKNTYEHPGDTTVRTDIYSRLSGCEIYYGLGPDNPSVSELSYMIQRVRGCRAVFVNVIETYGAEAGSIRSVSCQMSGEQIEITVEQENQVQKMAFAIEDLAGFQPVPGTRERVR